MLILSKEAKRTSPKAKPREQGQSNGLLKPRDKAKGKALFTAYPHKLFLVTFRKSFITSKEILCKQKREPNNVDTIQRFVTASHWHWSGQK